MRWAWCSTMLLACAACLDNTGPGRPIIVPGAVLAFEAFQTEVVPCGLEPPPGVTRPPDDPCQFGTLLAAVGRDTISATITVAAVGRGDSSSLVGTLNGVVESCALAPETVCVTAAVAAVVPIRRDLHCVVIAPDQLPDCTPWVALEVGFNLPPRDGVSRRYVNVLSVAERDGRLEEFHPSPTLGSTITEVFGVASAWTLRRIE